MFGGTPSTLDDHFDGTTLNAKWTRTLASGIAFSTFVVVDSKLSLGAWNNTDTADRGNIVEATLPNSNSFTITIQVDLFVSTRQR